MVRINWKVSFIIGFLFLANLDLNKKSIADNKSFEWHPVGVDQYGNVSQWINFSSYEELNKDSFRMQIKLVEENKQVLGRIDINCRNKDYYLRKKRQMSQKKSWNIIPQGSSFEEIAQFYCKKTSAAHKWGYTSDTKYLWNIKKPISNASNLRGDWITVYKNRSSEFKYNSNIKSLGEYVLAAYNYRKNNFSTNTNYISTKTKYGWIAVSCNSNIHSIFKKLEGTDYGEWLPPKTSPPGGGAWKIRNAACD